MNATADALACIGRTGNQIIMDPIYAARNSTLFVNNYEEEGRSYSIICKHIDRLIFKDDIEKAKTKNIKTALMIDCWEAASLPPRKRQRFI